MFCVPRVRRDLAESTLITLTSTLWHMAYCFGKGYITLEPRDKAQPQSNCLSHLNVKGKHSKQGNSVQLLPGGTPPFKTTGHSRGEVNHSCEQGASYFSHEAPC